MKYERAVLLVAPCLLGALACGPATSAPDYPALSGGSAPLATGTVFINELHYDNAGSDVDEAIEVAGPAGTDLTGYSLVLYNGKGGVSYNTLALSGVLADQRDGFGTAVVNLPSNGLQNGSPDGVALVDNAGTVLEFLSYEGSFAASDGPASGLTSEDVGVREGNSTPVGHSLQRTGEDHHWTGPAPASFGAPNEGQVFGGGASEDPDPEPEPDAGADADDCGDPSTPVFAIQGSGAESPLQGEQVRTEAVVVADFRGADRLGGVFVQDPRGDDDPATSDGVFVYLGSAGDELDLRPGDLVRVRGEVRERYGQTQLNAAAAPAVCERGLTVAATPVTLPVPEEGALEAYEGMLITFDQPLTLTDHRNLSRYGELVVSAGGRLHAPTNETADEQAREALRRDNARRQLLVDDGSTRTNPDVLPRLSDDGTLRLGDTIAGLTGVLGYGFNAYRLQPTETPRFERTNPRQAAPPAVGGDLRIASFNVLNYFLTLGERGADTEEERARQRAKLVATLQGLDADIVGLLELENGSAAVQDLVTAYNDAAGALVYEALDPGTWGDDQIRVGLIYKPSRVTPQGEPLPISFEGLEGARGDRRSLAQGFRFRGQRFGVIVNHFKSKGCGSASGANLDHGEGCWSALRTAQAQAVVDALPSVQQAVGSEDVLLIGDLNAYGFEAPVLTLEGGGLHNLIKQHVPEDQRYSFVFSGRAGDLDHALATPSLAARVTGVSIWHINADEPALLDYNTEQNPPALYAPDPFRSSDHDPVLIGLALPADPVAMIDALMERVRQEVRPRWAPRAAQIALLQPLRAAKRALTRGRSSWALWHLETFRRRLRWQRVLGRVDGATAHALREDAAAIEAKVATP